MGDAGVDAVMQGEADDAVFVRAERPAMASTCARKRASFTWLGCPARSRLASCGLTLCRITPAGRRYTTAMSVIVAPARIRWQPANTKLHAHSSSWEGRP